MLFTRSENVIDLERGIWFPATGWALEHSLFVPRLLSILDILDHDLGDMIGTAV